VDNTISSKFQQDLEPLIHSIEIIYKLEMVPFILAQKGQYKDGFLVANSSKSIYNEFLKKSFNRCLDLLSNDYIKKLKQLYFTDEGINLFILSSVTDYCNQYIADGGEM
jgi:hypothetical protein